MSGYELKKQLTVKLGAFWRVSYGSLYPCLKRLAADGASRAGSAPPTPQNKAWPARPAGGSALFRRLLESADACDVGQDGFPLRLAFSRSRRPEPRLDQLERRRGYLQARLADLRA